MSEENNDLKRLSRRNLLKAGAAAGVAAALPAGSTQAAQPYFSVSDADMRRTRPVLTVVDGKIAYDAGVV